MKNLEDDISKLKHDVLSSQTMQQELLKEIKELKKITDDEIYAKKILSNFCKGVSYE